MLMDEGLDTGDMLLKEETEILPEDNSITLAERLSNIGAELLVKTIKGLSDRSVKPVPQIGDSSYAPIIRKEDGKIDWSSPAVRIWNLVRGMYPWPGAFCDMQDERLTVLRARAAEFQNSGKPGCIYRISSDELLVSTGNGVISLMEVKPEGRKAMTGAAYANGRRLKEGACFEP
jgi:methionyl-tRNA formyltransferase